MYYYVIQGMGTRNFNPVSVAKTLVNGHAVDLKSIPNFQTRSCHPPRDMILGSGSDPGWPRAEAPTPQPVSIRAICLIFRITSESYFH